MMIINGTQRSALEASALDELAEAVVINVTAPSAQSRAALAQAGAYVTYVPSIEVQWSAS